MAVTLYSNQLTEQRAAANTPSDTNEQGGRLRYAYGKYTTNASTGLADGTTVAMVRIPAGARLVSLKVTSDSMGSSSEACDVGVAGADGSGYYNKAETSLDDIDLISADLDMATANVREEAIVTEAAVGITFDKEVFVTATAETDAWGTSADAYFEAEYVLD